MKQQDYQTPCYCMNLQKFKENCMAIAEPFQKKWKGKVEFGYSVKTNHNETLMRYAAEELGWYIETVSIDEYHYACEITTPERIIFNGPCKQEMLLKAYQKGGVINLDHLAEVEMLCQSVRELAQNGSWNKPHAEIGLRLNFDLEKLCPGETTAGESVNRFGICYENGDFKRAVAMLHEAGISIDGIHLHTSTKSRSIAVFTALAQKAAEMAAEYQLKLKYVDMGGGFFGGQKVEGKPTMEAYAKAICTALEKQFIPAETRLILEPGASVIATCITYLTRAINVRDIRGTRVVTLDGTLLHINPFLSHRTPAYDWSGAGTRENQKHQLICGSTCMENDRFLELFDAKCVETGDLFTFLNAGAYTMAFNSDFILHPPKIYVEK